MTLLRRFPATIACSAAMIGVFIYEIVLSMACCPIHSLADAFTVATQPSVIASAGGLMNDAMQWWRFVSAIFVHFGILHILLNLFALVQLGYLLEGLFGSRVFLFTFFASGVTSLIAGAAALMAQPGPSAVAGASGALFGVLGAVIVALDRSDELKRERWSSRLSRRLTGWAFLNIVLGAIFASLAAWIDSEYTVANAAHLGGLLTGLLIGMRPMSLRHNATSHAIIKRFGGQPPVIEAQRK